MRILMKIKVVGLTGLTGLIVLIEGARGGGDLTHRAQYRVGLLIKTRLEIL